MMTDFKALRLDRVLGGSPATLRMRDAGGNLHALLASGNLWLGGKTADGDLVLFAAGEKDNTSTSRATVHLDGHGGSLWLRDAKKNVHARLESGHLWLGGRKTDGDIFLFAKGATDIEGTSSPWNATVRLDGHDGSLWMQDAKRNYHAILENGNLWLGGEKADGDIFLFAKGAPISPPSATVHLDGDAGTLEMRDGKGNTHAFLDGTKGNLWLGGKGADGDIVLFAEEETDNRNQAKATVHLNGNTGDIILKNADCAEDFDIDCVVGLEPGTVMVIDADGKLQPSTSAYDRKVAGVISGAGRNKPAIILDRRPDSDKRLPLALVGKVYCKVDATSAPLGVGDLLTTSSTNGHAMKAGDPLRAFGAVIGKALGSLQGGTGLLPILVALQ